jgi:endonuclease/exonuclease/phosphatase family metal-dependent hydrolase
MTRKNRFKVGTFNVYNLNLPNVVFNRTQKYTEAEYGKKIRWIGNQLDRMQADLIGFQEVWRKEALEAAIEQSEHLKGAQVIIANDTGESISLAVASKLPIKGHQVIAEFPEAARLEIAGENLALTKFSRPILSVQVELQNGLACTFVVAHLKSKRPDLAEAADRNDPLENAKGKVRSLIRRSAEAVALRSILLDLLKDGSDPVIVVGDLNDSNLAVSTQLISGEPPWRKLPIAQKTKIWDVLLYHVKDIQARKSYEDFYYTYIHNGHHDSLDHIMVSQEFVDVNPKRMGRVGYVSVFNDHLIDETLSNDEVEPWQSDHGQVVASIELEKVD